MLRSGPHADLPAALGDLPDLVSALLRRIVEEAPTGRHRAALQVCAHAAVTTEPVLRAALPDCPTWEVSELWEWLRGLTFAERRHAGVRPHDVARDALDADLRWRDRDAYADIHRRLRAHAVDQVQATAGNPQALQQAVGDLLFLVRDHPVGGVGWDWAAFGEPPGRPVGSDQADLIVAMTRAAQGREQADLAAHWLRRQPEAFRLFHDSDGNIAGYVARLALPPPARRTSRPTRAPRWCGGTPSSIIRPGRGSRP